jgi:hypothetical protein
MESSIVQIPPHEAIVRELVFPLFQTRRWLRFLGVMSILSAILLIALTVGIGIIYAWLPIWVGIILFQAAGAMEEAYRSGNKHQLTSANSKIKTYFIIQGVTTLIGLIFGAIALFVAGMGVFLGILSEL